MKWSTFPGIFIIFIFISLIHPSGSNAQIAQLQVGDRVRITAPVVQSKRIKGIVTELDKSVLVLSVRDSSYYISESLIQRLETSTGRKRVIGRGLLIGSVAGTMLFGMMSAFTNNACGFAEDCVLENRNGQAYLTGATVGLIVGGTAGAVAGFFIKIDRWERVSFQIAMDVEQMPSGLNHKMASPGLSFRVSLGE